VLPVSIVCLLPQLLDLNEILSVGTQIAAGFLDVLKCNILPTLTGQVCRGMLALPLHSLQAALPAGLLPASWIPSGLAGRLEATVYTLRI